MRELSRNTKSVIENVVRSGRPAIVTINGRPQVAVTPLVGAVEAAEEHLLRNAPAQIQAAIREGEADLIGDRVALVEDSVFANLEEDTPPSGAEVLARLAEQLDTTALTDAIRLAPVTPNALNLIREALRDANLFTIGSPAGEPSSEGRTESDVITYTDEGDGGRPGVMLPAFTRVDALRSALIRNPDWQSLDVLQVSGRKLVENVDPDVTIIIDPWSDLEFMVPPTGRRTLVTEQPVAAASEVLAGA